jgi:uncharacterized membrane protein
MGNIPAATTVLKARPVDTGRQAAYAPPPLDEVLAAIQAPIILMSQNRQAEKDRLNAGHDYEVNLKAELEIMLLHEKMDLLREGQWSELLAIQKQQLRLLEDLMKDRAVAK